jgi:hypothetical protein
MVFPLAQSSTALSQSCVALDQSCKHGVLVGSVVCGIGSVMRVPGMQYMQQQTADQFDHACYLCSIVGLHCHPILLQAGHVGVVPMWMHVLGIYESICSLNTAMPDDGVHHVVGRQVVSR